MTDTSTQSTTDDTEADRSARRTYLPFAAIIVACIAVIAVDPAAAQQTPVGGEAATAICNNDSLSTLFGGLFTMLTAFGVLGALVVYKYQAVVGIVGGNPNQREKLQQRKQQVKSSVITVVAIDFVYIVGAPLLGLPQFGCIFG